MKYRKILLIASALVLLGTAGCGKKKKKYPRKNSKVRFREVQDKESQPVEGEAVNEEVPANQNLLTGLGDLSEGAIGKRPVAVMVNNVQKAMPQYGVGQADVIFEIPVEGDATRFMAMYGDYTKVPKVCPIQKPAIISRRCPRALMLSM